MITKRLDYECAVQGVLSLEPIDFGLKWLGQGRHNGMTSNVESDQIYVVIDLSSITLPDCGDHFFYLCSTRISPTLYQYLLKIDWIYGHPDRLAGECERIDSAIGNARTSYAG